MADPPATRDPATRYRDLLREVAAGTVLAIPAVTAWGMLIPATIRSGNFAVEDTPTGPGLLIWPILIGLIGLSVGWLGTITVLERRRPNPFGSRESWIAVALLASAVVIGFVVANGAGASIVAINLLEGGNWVWVDIPAGAAQFVVAWLGAFGVVFLVEHAIVNIVRSTRASRKAGVGEDRHDHELEKGSPARRDLIRDDV